MVSINVEMAGESDVVFIFNVELSDEESGTASIHKVSLNKSFYAGLQTAVTPTDVVKKSFEYLLDQESSDMVLPEFDLQEISRYFPEYNTKLKTLLSL